MQSVQPGGLLLLALAWLGGGSAQAAGGAAAVDIGSRRELFVDTFLIDTMKGVQLKMQTPQYAPPCDQRAPSTAYTTIFRDGDVFRLYGRVNRKPGILDSDPTELRWFNQVYVYAESRDGIHWTEPNLGIYDNVPEVPQGNVVLAWEFGTTHNFMVFLDARPGVPAGERYKAIGGMRTAKEPELVKKHGPGGLRAYVSADGLHWKRLRDDPIIPNGWGAFDSQNVAFWSETERCYVCYFRAFLKGVRAFRRSTSQDFLQWTQPVDIPVNLPGEQLYVNNIKPYFRAPHLYLGLPTRISFNHGGMTETLLITSRDGVHFDRTFMEAYLRPGLGISAYGYHGYTNRGHYVSHHVIQTGPTELSVYAYDGRRFVLRLDGFASLNAPYAGGEMVTRALVFRGSKLQINAATAGAGYVRAEIQDANRQVIPGYALADSQAFIGDDVAHVVAWKGGTDVAPLAGKPVRLRFVMKDADLYSLRFLEGKERRR